MVSLQVESDDWRDATRITIAHGNSRYQEAANITLEQCAPYGRTGSAESIRGITYLEVPGEVDM
jgi:hypothetical protein